MNETRKNLEMIGEQFGNGKGKGIKCRQACKQVNELNNKYSVFFFLEKIVFEVKIVRTYKMIRIKSI